MVNKNILFIGLLLFFGACQKADTIYEKNYKITGTWNKDSCLLFTPEIKDSLSPYNLIISVKHNHMYPNSNLWLFMATRSPAGKLHVDTMECILANEHGQWYGNGRGDSKSLRLPYRLNTGFHEVGVYTFSLQQGMRYDELPAIEQIGFSIEKSD